MTEEVKVLIIGSGPSGYTAAIYAARAGLQPVLITGNEPGGQLTTTNDVENFPGYPEGINGPQMMLDFQKQAEKYGTEVRYGFISSVDFSSYPLKAIVDEKYEIKAQSIIISTGASAKYLGLPSEKKYLNKGVSACAVCDGFFYKGKNVALVGGGDTASEEAIYLSNLCKKVFMIVRRDELRASKIMQERILNISNIEILWNSEIQEILGDGESVNGIKISDKFNNTTKNIEVGGVFVAIGHKPNTEIFTKYLETDNNGYLKVESGSTKTKIPGVFVTGDAVDKVYRQAVTAAGSGCMGALDAERFLQSKSVK